MPLYCDNVCVLHTEYLVACWAVNGEGHADGEYALHVLLQVGRKRERAGWLYPTREQRDAAIQVLGTLAGSLPIFDDDTN